MKIEVEVMEQDIRLGEQNMPTTCAVARAVKRALPRELKESVEAGSGCISCSGWDWPCTKKVKEFIERFDRDKTKCKPFKFTIRVGDTLYIPF